MSRQRSSTLFLASLSRVTALAVFLRCRTAKPVPLKARRYLATNSLPASDGSRVSSPTDYSATKQNASPTKKLTFPDPDPDPSLPIVEYDAPLCRVRRNVKVSAKTNADTLFTAMSPLLSAHMSKLKFTKSVGSKGWQLELDGAGIVRFFAFDSDVDATKFVNAVRVAADEMDHHPEIATSAPHTKDTTSVRYLAISCNTHRPPGLSMRDVRLARKIDELAEPFNYMATTIDITSRNALRAIRRNLVRELQSRRGRE